MAVRTIPLGMGGTLESYGNGRWPRYADGGYPILYYQAGGTVFCWRCANQGKCAEPIVGADLFHEGASEFCEGCGREIRSFYGDPDAPEPLRTRKIGSGRPGTHGKTSFSDVRAAWRGLLPEERPEYIPLATWTLLVGHVTDRLTYAAMARVAEVSSQAIGVRIKKATAMLRSRGKVVPRGYVERLALEEYDPDEQPVGILGALIARDEARARAGGHAGS